MGFGFNLFFAFILVPLLAILLLLWLVTQKRIIGKAIAAICIGVLSLIIFSSVLHAVFNKKILSKHDYYGTYVIDKEIISGKQADWQYDHFRFEIKDNDSIYFYVTDKNRILQKYKGTIATVKPGTSERLLLHMLQPTHRVLTTNPTVYRSAWGFTLVFDSPKFGNMFFTKGSWEEK